MTSLLVLEHELVGWFVRDRVDGLVLDTTRAPERDSDMVEALGEATDGIRTERSLEKIIRPPHIEHLRHADDEGLLDEEGACGTVNVELETELGGLKELHGERSMRSMISARH